MHYCVQKLDKRHAFHTIVRKRYQQQRYGSARLYMYFARYFSGKCKCMESLFFRTNT